MATFLLELVTPEKTLLSEQVRSVRAPGVEGSFGVLPNHAPLMSALAIGVIKVEHENGDIEYIATSGGFMEVNANRAVILAHTAERAADIDVSRAEAALARAREHLRSGSAIDYEEVTQALTRAMNRLRVVQMQNGEVKAR
ncbi:MAG: F0F1 ATP synthase subunit epsilon [Chthonomonadales bacterium]